MSDPNSAFKPIGKKGFGIQPINNAKPPMGGDTHDTFGVDKNGNIVGGHTTVRIPGGQTVPMPWNS